MRITFSALTTNFDILVSTEGRLVGNETINNKLLKAFIISSLCLIPPPQKQHKSKEISLDCENAEFTFINPTKVMISWHPSLTEYSANKGFCICTDLSYSLHRFMNKL